MKFIFIILILVTFFTYGAEEKKYVGGQIVLDTATIIGDDFSGTGREVRSARVFIDGKFGERTEYEIEYSFTGNNEWKDVYVKHKLFDNLGIQIGNMKEPMSLEQVSSSKNSSFSERSLINTFINHRKLGVMVQGKFKQGVQRGGITLGIFGKSLDKLFEKKEDGVSIISRITYALVYAKDDILHLGVSIGQTNYHQKKIKLSTDAGSHLYENSLLKRKIKNIEKTKRIGIESAMVKGAFSFQGEYLSFTALSPKEHFKFDGWYGQISWFATGEHKKYKVKSAKFSQTKIKKSALEFAFRASKIRIKDKDQIPQEELDLTIAINYYHRQNIRLISSYTFAQAKKKQTQKENLLQLRLLYTF